MRADLLGKDNCIASRPRRALMIQWAVRLIEHAGHPAFEHVVIGRKAARCNDHGARMNLVVAQPDPDDRAVLPDQPVHARAERNI